MTAARSGQRGARLLLGLAVFLSLGVPAIAFIVSYEGNGPPSPPAWERFVDGTPERRLEDGWLIETVQQGDQDDYNYELGGISSLVGRFFLEWRAVTDSPEWLIYASQTPAVVVAGGQGAAFYHVVMTESAAVLFRDAFIPWVVVQVAGNQPHTYRIEVFADEYLWHIDGVVVDSGVPQGPYPDPNAAVVWGVNGYQGLTMTTAFDYLRFGEIPEDASGDYNSTGFVTLGDYRFVHECLAKAGPDLFAGPDQNAGPGCRFTDFDFDADADLLDFSEFANHFTGSQ